MSDPVRSGLQQRLTAFIAERHPFAVRTVTTAFARILDRADISEGRLADAIDAIRPLMREIVRDAILDPVGDDVPHTTPGVSANERIVEEIERLKTDIDGFLRRESITASITPDEKREMLRGMMTTRATDNRLKSLFTGGDVRWKGAAFQGKGFRSLGQEAIYAAPLRLRRGDAWRTVDGRWKGDVVAPLIRDLGAALAMRLSRESVRMVLRAQMGKGGPPMDGRDLHIGDWEYGVLPASAPLTISTLTVAGLAMAFHRDDSGRVAVSFIGEGGSSLGEWHEAINLCAARRLPAIFCVQNNQTALSTPVHEQSAVRVFADKAIGYGIPAVTIDGTDPEAIAAAFAWAAERAREGLGPSLIETVSMRMCGHAHHDDMLYLGRDPQPSWTYPDAAENGYVDRERYEFWRVRDPIACYTARLIAEHVVTEDEVELWKRDITSMVDEEARGVIDDPWPDAARVGSNVATGHTATRIDVLEAGSAPPVDPTPLTVETAPPFDAKGRTFLEGVMLGVGDALAADERTFVYGEDCGGAYGNAFLLLRPLLARFPERIINSTLAEGGVIGVCVGAALAGQRPIGEIQFNDFVATGFNQLVNNAAKTRYRWGAHVPMVLRMPWGGLRHAGPYHSQNTEAWFYRTPGLKIVCPSSPHDARALMAAAVADPDPVLYYEHIALYRDPRVKQQLSDDAPLPIEIGRAALRRDGSDLAIIAWGAFVHVAMRVAGELAREGVESSVLDLRTIAPLDRNAVLALARRCNRVLIIHEDTRTGSVGESIAAIIQEEAFEWLDAPVRIIGALDTPVPYSPPLEEAFLPSEGEILAAARRLMEY